MGKLPPIFHCLRNRLFAQLYLAQAISLLGDALTWVGLALLAFELAGQGAGLILAGALTLRVTVFVLLSPIAGAIADRYDRKQMMVITHLARLGIVCLFPGVTQAWQIYGLVLGLNVFNAFFTPTYTATIPLVTKEDEYPQAIALSSATYQLLGVLGPGLAGSLAAWVGTKTIFWGDALTFLMAAGLIFTLPGKLLANSTAQPVRNLAQIRRDIGTGTQCLFGDRLIRYALAMQLVVSLAGAGILVNTVGYVQGILNLGKLEYGWLMAAFGLGATVASLGLGNTQQQRKRIYLTTIGAVVMSLAILPVSMVNLQGLLLLWAGAGIGQTLVNVPTQTLIADRVAKELQGRVYGANFAWSHLWWAFSYPLAGWLGSHFAQNSFFYLGILALSLFALFYLLRPSTPMEPGFWHEHSHHHDSEHSHFHPATTVLNFSHNHLHFHFYKASP
ncbi:nickel resistance [Synechocystis sp. PCC 6803]|uniref:Nickel resistance n=1 Tax=Synechocystis sp. (strain ATCC 27184 / PCC 6803 / Kazusa) TaxID=1111708 RepID=Q55937_SYNY3|nr:MULTISPECIES: MFS transporter [unclassified Synechocystis]AGF52993.1 nickel resistance [Synechocystis sp. PCC 6803]ALJ69563.1 NAD+ synthetase [Synechocystis sp. PCC 6803]AVP91376.1 MFS transporter [Synechocystis sp. IPPAS B-1465]MBD2618790.1 MFS transporter [Synechocystis sp. FACHB-898]MBD2640685.1 MFS transporter [Synechocystis sp. FACHB-908]